MNKNKSERVIKFKLVYLIWNKRLKNDQIFWQYTRKQTLQEITEG